MGDYISFILPISQLNNSIFMYEFDLLYSEDLGELVFSECRKVRCCLNIYVRPEKGLNKKSKKTLKDVEIVRSDSKKYSNFEYDIRMCQWGDVGKILKEGENYSSEYKIKIHNEDLKDKIVDILFNTDWKKEITPTTLCGLCKHHIIEVLKRNIPEIN